MIVHYSRRVLSKVMSYSLLSKRFSMVGGPDFKNKPNNIFAKA